MYIPGRPPGRQVAGWHPDILEVGEATPYLWVNPLWPLLQAQLNLLKEKKKKNHIIYTLWRGWKVENIQEMVENR